MTVVTPKTLADRVVDLTEGWEMATPKYKIEQDLKTPTDAAGLKFTETRAPGTVAATLRDGWHWSWFDSDTFDNHDNWFRCTFAAEPPAQSERVFLKFGGIATVSEVWLNDQPILQSNSMFASHEVDVTELLKAENQLVIVCRALSHALTEKRKQKPALRWKTKVVSDQNLRWFRTTILGRAPGFAPHPEAVGPWRPVQLIRRESRRIENWQRKVSLDGDAGVAELSFDVHGLSVASGTLHVGEHSARLRVDGAKASATLRIPSAKKWWPHTHGTPAMYPVHVELIGQDGKVFSFEDQPAGFRSIIAKDGFALHINDLPIFCRGVVWMPPDEASLAAPRPSAKFEATLRQRLESLRDAGFNLLRIPGTTIYHDEEFHSLCDQLGLLVWQDMMFANLDYPFGDAGFHSQVTAEAETELSRLAHHPSTAVICGNSEIEQQVGMLGLDPSLGRGEFFGKELPAIAQRCCPGVPYVPSAPCSNSENDLPFHPRAGIANYFGVGAYLRPFEDARRAEVRFASECLAFSNVPEEVEAGLSPIHPKWKRGVPRDAGAGWDFEDVRDHYLKLLFGVDAAALRYADPQRYFDLSRMVSGEVMAEVFGEWRRAKSPCNGGIILWSGDLYPGAGWGILDGFGHPKPVYWFLKRALAARAVWMTDEGLNGIDVHVANDKPEPFAATLRVAVYRAGEIKIAEGRRELALAPHQSISVAVEQILGRFVDVSYAYRFGPPQHDLVVASVHEGGSDTPLMQAFRFPLGRSAQRIPIAELGIGGQVSSKGGEVVLSARKFAYGVKLISKEAKMDDAYFHLEPCVSKRVRVSGQGPFSVTAMNAEGKISLDAGAAV